MKYMIATLSLVITALVFAAPIKSNLGASASMNIEQTIPFENPYVSDGLVAMFDGEWNAGWGKHNPNATIWKDLIGKGTVRPYSSSLQIEFGENYASVVGLLFTIPNFSNIKDIGEWTIQVCETTINNVENYTPRICIAGNQSMLIYESNRSITTMYSTQQLRMTDTKGQATRTIVVSGGRYRVYVNGFASAWASVGMGDKGNDSVAVFSYVTSNYRQYKGRCSRFAIYNRALTADEISHNYAIDKERFGLP